MALVFLCVFFLGAVGEVDRTLLFVLIFDVVLSFSLDACLAGTSLPRVDVLQSAFLHRSVLSVGALLSES